VVGGSWDGLLAPAGTPRDIIARLHAELMRALADPEVRERLTSVGTEVVGNSPEEFAAQIRADIEKRAGLFARPEFVPNRSSIEVG
jgi:tripartite-type tricarboxylate transporter receptor subunit TctC